MSTSIHVNGSHLHCESFGEGPAILVMHGGLGLSHDYLRPYFDRLAATHTVVLYDHFGNGRSEKPADYAEMSFAKLTADADALMTELGHENSYGGFIAQEFAAQYGHRLSGLVLVDTVPAFDYEPPMSGSDEQMQAFGKLFSTPMANDAEWRDTWGLVVQMYFRQWDAEIGTDLDARTVYDHRAWNASGALLGSFNTLDKLPNIQTPALVMAGRHDPITPPAPGAERIARLLPAAQLQIFEDSGHYPFIEERESFFATLETWLARCSVQIDLAHIQLRHVVPPIGNNANGCHDLRLQAFRQQTARGLKLAQIQTHL